MASKRAKAEFNAIVTRRNELKNKHRLSNKERAELEELETTLEIAPTANKFEELHQQFVHGRRQLAKGDAFVLKDDEDYEAFRAWLKE